MLSASVVSITFGDPAPWQVNWCVEHDADALLAHADARGILPFGAGCSFTANPKFDAIKGRLRQRLRVVSNSRCFGSSGLFHCGRRF